VCGLTKSHLLSEKDTTLEKAATLATSIEMAILEPQGKYKPLVEDDIRTLRKSTEARPDNM